MNFITEKIEKFRAERGWTVYKLSQESGIAQPTIHKWIGSPESFPSIPALIQICEAFRITLVEFLLDSELVELTAERKSLFDKWKLLTKNQQEAISAIINGYLENK